MSNFQAIVKKEMQVGPMSTFPERLEDALDPLLECARYIVEFEEEDWEEAVYHHGTEELFNHIFAKAYTALYGEAAFLEKAADLEEKLRGQK